MGKVPPLTAQMHIRINSTLLEQVHAAAARMDQPVTGWVRLAILEKLERDLGGRVRLRHGGPVVERDAS